MIKKDLERVGIPYRTEEGTADFHAVGRHTHITELLRNGASLVEARELARHSDIRMTMRYSHIGLNDQARAVSAIPAPPAPAGKGIGLSPQIQECLRSKTVQRTLSVAVIGWQHSDHGTGHR